MSQSVQAIVFYGVSLAGCLEDEWDEPKDIPKELGIGYHGLGDQQVPYIYVETSERITWNFGISFLNDEKFERNPKWDNLILAFVKANNIEIKDIPKWCLVASYSC